MLNQDYFSEMISRLEPFIHSTQYADDSIHYFATTDEDKEYLIITDLDKQLDSIALVEYYKGYQIVLTISQRSRILC